MQSLPTELHAGPKGRRRAGCDQEEEEKRQRQCKTPGSAGNEQKEVAGEAACCPHTYPSPSSHWSCRRGSKWKGSWRRKQNPQAWAEESNRHVRTHTEHCDLPKLGDEIASPLGYGVARSGNRRPSWVMLAAFGIFQKHTLTHTLAPCADTVLFKAACPHSGTWLKSDCPCALCQFLSSTLNMDLCSVDWKLLRFYPENNVVSV